VLCSGLTIVDFSRLDNEKNCAVRVADFDYMYLTFMPSLAIVLRAEAPAKPLPPTSYPMKLMNRRTRFRRAKFVHAPRLVPDSNRLPDAKLSSMTVEVFCRRATCFIVPTFA